MTECSAVCKAPGPRVSAAGLKVSAEPSPNHVLTADRPGRSRSEQVSVSFIHFSVDVRTGLTPHFAFLLLIAQGYSSWPVRQTADLSGWTRCVCGRRPSPQTPHSGHRLRGTSLERGCVQVTPRAGRQAVRVAAKSQAFVALLLTPCALYVIGVCKSHSRGLGEAPLGDRQSALLLSYSPVYEVWRRCWLAEPLVCSPCTEEENRKGENSESDGREGAGRGAGATGSSAVGRARGLCRVGAQCRALRKQRSPRMSA